MSVSVLCECVCVGVGGGHGYLREWCKRWGDGHAVVRVPAVAVGMKGARGTKVRGEHPRSRGHHRVHKFRVPYTRS